MILFSKSFNKNLIIPPRFKKYIEITAFGIFKKKNIDVIIENTSSVQDMVTLIENQKNKIKENIEIEEYTKELFRALRTIEKSGAEIIIAEDPGSTGIALALRDRLERAAGK